MELFLAVVAVLLAGGDAASKHSAPPFEEAHELLSLGEQLRLQERDLIVLLGSVGAERAHLARFVTQDEALRVRRRGGGRFVFDASDQNRSTLGGQLQEAMPRFFRDKATGHMMVELAAFSDARSPRLDVAAAYLGHQVLRQADRIKVVLVENFANLRDGSDGAGLSRLLRHVSRILPDVALLGNSLGLVVAKVRAQDGDDGQVLGDVLNFLSTFREDLEANSGERPDEVASMLQVLDAVYANGTAENVALFRQPDQEGVPWASPAMSQSLRELRVLLFGSLEFRSSVDLILPYALTPRSRDFVLQHLIPDNNKVVNRYLGKVLDEFTECVEREVKARSLVEDKATFLADVSGRLDDLLEQSGLFKDISGIKGLKERLGAICTAWKSVDLSILDNMLRSTELLYDLAEANVANFLLEVKMLAADKARHLRQAKFFYSFAESLSHQLRLYHVQAVRKSVLVTLTLLNFKQFVFGLSKFDLEAAHREQVVGMEPSRRMLSDLNALLDLHLNHTARLSFSNFGQQVIYEGRNLLLREFSDELSRFQNLRHVFLFATDTVFVDADLTLTDAHLAIAAPHVVIVGANRTMRMLGSDGESFIEGSPGPSQGQPGQDGHDAGDVVVLALQVDGADRLTVRSDGGDGGRGQDGADGPDGSEAAPPHFEELYPHFQNGVATWDEVKGHGYALEHVDQNTLALVNRQGWGAPGAGGHGGAGGRFGRAGSSLFLTEQGLQRPPEVLVQDGIPGEHGHGGRGGRGPSTCVKKFYSGRCKTKHCEIEASVQRSHVDKCKCKFQSVQVCDKIADAKDGVKGFHRKEDPNENPFRFDWRLFAQKFNSSVLVNERLQARENLTDLRSFIDYFTRTLTTLEQVFWGLHSYNCRG